MLLQDVYLGLNFVGIRARQMRNVWQQCKTCEIQSIKWISFGRQPRIARKFLTQIPVMSVDSNSSSHLLWVKNPNSTTVPTFSCPNAKHNIYPFWLMENNQNLSCLTGRIWSALPSNVESQKTTFRPFRSLSTLHSSWFLRANCHFVPRTIGSLIAPRASSKFLMDLRPKFSQLRMPAGPIVFPPRKIEKSKKTLFPMVDRANSQMTVYKFIV